MPAPAYTAGRRSSGDPRHPRRRRALARRPDAFPSNTPVDRTRKATSPTYPSSILDLHSEPALGTGFTPNTAVRPRRVQISTHQRRNPSRHVGGRRSHSSRAVPRRLNRYRSKPRRSRARSSNFHRCNLQRQGVGSKLNRARVFVDLNLRGRQTPISERSL